jgi:hypothetical protein
MEVKLPLNNDPTKNLSPKAMASNQAQHIIGQNFVLKSDINIVRQIFYQTEFKLISILQFETSEEMRILNIHHVISK